jgi:hypothetical protein
MQKQLQFFAVAFAFYKRGDEFSIPGVDELVGVTGWFCDAAN